MKLIVHAGTGTIINADDSVFVLDTDVLTDDENQLIDDDENSTVELAIKKGRLLTNDALDVTTSNSMVFTPFSIRYEIEASKGLIVDKEFEDWILNKATDEQLREVSSIAITDELLWENYSDVLVGALLDVYNKQEVK